MLKRGRSALYLVAAAAAAVMIACPSQAMPPVNTTAEGLAIKGYDPVAYFTRGEPTKGSGEFVYEWKGAKWRFATREHLEIFKEDPEKYAPQYGGY